MLEHSSERIIELMKILDYSWEYGIIPKNDYNYLTIKLKEGDTDTVENYLKSKNIDNKIIEDLPSRNSNIKSEKKHYNGYLYQKETSDYSYFEDKIDKWKSLCHDLENKNTNLIEQLKNLKESHDDMRRKHNILIKEIQKIETERSSITEEIHILTSENNELKNKFQQERIDEKIPVYVEDVGRKLDDADQFFTTMSKYWSIAGFVLAMLAVIAAFCTFIYGLETVSDVTKLTPISIAYTFVRGGLGIALLSWLSYISLSNARNYTHESILRKDRQHALTFGRLFLQIYGSTATKEDAINVFKDWNMSGDTAFSSKSKTPPNPLSAINSLKNYVFKQNDTNTNSSKTAD